MKLLAGETPLTGDTWVGDYGGETICLACLNERYPRTGMGKYVAEIDDEDYCYIDGEITADGIYDRLLQQSRYGKLRSVNSSECIGKSLEPNCEFVLVGEVDGGDFVLEIRVIPGKTVYPGDEILCAYGFKATKKTTKKKKLKKSPAAAPTPGSAGGDDIRAVARSNTSVCTSCFLCVCIMRA